MEATGDMRTKTRTCRVMDDIEWFHVPVQGSLTRLCVGGGIVCLAALVIVRRVSCRVEEFRFDRPAGTPRVSRLARWGVLT
jgi:hypothetical protein